jgi:hypothetical protein
MEKKSVVTKVQKREEYFVQFTPEEMESLGIEPGDKFEVETPEEGGVMLKKMPSIEIDLHALGVDTLAALVTMSIEEQKPVDDVIVELLSGYVRSQPPISVE